MRRKGTVFEASDNLEWYNSMFALHYTESSMQDQAISAFAAERSIILSESCVERTGFSVGDTLTLSNGATTDTYVVVGSLSRGTDVESVIPSTYAFSDYSKATYGLLAYYRLIPM